MTQFFKGLALFLVITCIVWVAVLWHWDSSHHELSIADIVIYLAALPLVIFGVLIGLRWAWTGAQPRREAALAAAAAAAAAARTAATAGTADSTPTSEDALRFATAQLLGAYATCAGGATPQELLIAAAEGKPRPAFDAELRDTDGLSVMCARLKDLQTEPLATQLEPLLQAQRQQRPEWVGLAFSEHALRALAALVEPLQNALRGLQPWATRLGAPDQAAPSAAPPPRQGAAPVLPMVRLLLGWPEGWSELECAVATDWVQHQWPEHTDIPMERFVCTAQASSGEALWLQADQLLQTLAREGRSDVLLVAACHSDLSDSAVAALEQQGRLFSAQRQPKGLMPGEAAAVLLLAHEDWPAAPDVDLPAMRLHRPALMRRDKSVEAAGRVNSQCLQDTAADALAASRVAAAAVAALVCDADQHSPRGTELFGATLALLPQLDPTEDMRLLGTVTAHTGAVNVLLVLAAAAQRARDDDQPCLALCLGDRFMRLAVLARPAALAAPGAAATAAAAA